MFGRPLKCRLKRCLDIICPGTQTASNVASKSILHSLEKYLRRTNTRKAQGNKKRGVRETYKTIQRMYNIYIVNYDIVNTRPRIHTFCILALNERGIHFLYTLSNGNK